MNISQLNSFYLRCHSKRLLINNWSIVLAGKKTFDRHINIRSFAMDAHIFRSSSSKESSLEKMTGKEMTELKSNPELYLSNSLTELPPEVWNLTQLEVLNLNKNFLAVLPAGNDNVC